MGFEYQERAGARDADIEQISLPAHLTFHSCDPRYSVAAQCRRGQSTMSSRRFDWWDSARGSRQVTPTFSPQDTSDVQAFPGSS